MKKISYFMLTACFMSLASCSSDTDCFDAADNTLTISAVLPQDEGSRVDFNSDITKMAWQQGDKLTVMGYGADGNYVSNSMSSAVKTGASQSAATFDVSLSSSWNSVEFTYMGSKASVNGADKKNPYSMSFDGQVQQGAGSMAHLKDYILLKSPKIAASQLSGSHKTFALAPATSILKLNVKNLPVEMAAASSYSFKYYINYGTAAQVCSAALTLNGTLTAGADNYVYMMFSPVAGALEAGNKIAFEIKAGTKTAIACATSTEKKTYAAGKIYTAVLDYSNTSNLKWTVSDSEETLAEPVGYREPVVLSLISGQGCGNCPWTEDSRQREQDQYGADKYILAVLHGLDNFSKPKGEVQLYNEEANTYRESLGHDKSAPQPFFNNLGTSFHYRNVTDALVGNDLLECRLDVKLNADNTYQISVDTHLRKDRKEFASGKNIDLLLWALEDGIYAPQTGAKGGYMTHNHILRGSINGTWGEPYKVGTSYKGTFKIPSAVSVKENTDVVVLFIDHTTKEIYDASHFKIGVSKAEFK